MPERRRSDDGSGLAAGLVRATGAVLGFHVRIAQREARGDLSRMVTGAVLVALACLALALAVVGAHVAGVIALATLTTLTWLRAVALVTCLDVLLVILCATLARARLRRPILRETRSMLRDTLASFAGIAD